MEVVDTILAMRAAIEIQPRQKISRTNVVLPRLRTISIKMNLVKFGSPTDKLQQELFQRNAISVNLARRQ